jgi:uncharacterized protein YbjQ (UPF0145 family)
MPVPTGPNWDIRASRANRPNRANRPSRANLAISALRTRTFLPAVTDNSTDTTSGLTVDEQLAIAQVGYEPQDVVNGAAVVRLGYNGKNSLHPFRNYEVSRLSTLLNNARMDAVREMEGQCSEIDAAGVIGVHLDLYGTERDDLVTFVASGTAVRATDPENSGSGPAFTSSLSGQDFHLLLRSGCEPVRFVVGTSVFHFGWRSLGRWAASQGRPIEMVSLTQSLYAAREAAVQQLQERAKAVGADGVINVRVIERADVWGSHVIEFVAYGTAIKTGSRWPDAVDPDILVLLNDNEPQEISKTSTFDRSGAVAGHDELASS